MAPAAAASASQAWARGRVDQVGRHLAGSEQVRGDEPDPRAPAAAPTPAIPTGVALTTRSAAPTASATEPSVSGTTEPAGPARSAAS